MPSKTLARTTRTGSITPDVAEIVSRSIGRVKPIQLTAGTHFTADMNVARIGLNRQALDSFGVKLTVTNKKPWTESEKRAAKKAGESLPKGGNRRPDTLFVTFGGVRSDASDAALARLADLVGDIGELPTVEPQNRGARAAKQLVAV